MGNHAKDASYLGLDIGSTSVGWAVTNDAYELCRFKGKDMWGVRLFDEANTAAERRMARVQRRRIQRRNQRLALLQELFAQPISQVDPSFFQRMNAARLLPEDKAWKYTLFEQAGFTDREYHRKYPTIYHLRQALMEQDGPFDVRLVYLAIHHILKKRGHFLFADLGDGKMPTPRETLHELEARFRDELDMEMVCSDAQALEELLTDASLRKTEKQKRMNALFSATTPGQKAWIKLLAGASANLADLYADDSLKEAEQKSAEFSKAGYEDELPAMEAVLGERIVLLEAWRAVYNWGILQRLLRGCPSISAAKVALYEQNEKDLRELKAVIRKFGTKEQYDRIFRDPQVTANYGHLIGMVRVDGKKLTVKRCKQEEFCKFIEKELKTLEPNERVTALLSKAQEQSLLPKLISGDNSVIPYQLHKMELERILEKAAAYLPFLHEKDADGLTAAQKISMLLEFRIPYYVGPLNAASKNSWFKRKEAGAIYPWNFEKKVDLTQSAAAFIDRMTAKCTYLRGCDVLPACSPTYERFAVLNEINPMTLKGEPISVSLKQELVEHVFMQVKKPTLRNILGFLKSRGYPIAKEEIGGIDVEGGIKNSLKTTIALKAILGDNYSETLAEEIVAAATYFGDDRKLLKAKLQQELGLEDAVVGQILRLRCSGWGRLSGELFHQIVVDVTAEHSRYSLLEALWHTNETLMGLLGDRYAFRDAIEIRNREADEQSMDDFINELYVSPSVKRQIHQTVTVVKELRKAIGHDPSKIFVEMARGEDKKKERKPERKQTLLACYEHCKEDARELYERLEGTESERLRQDKLYLYYTQMGRCMYSGDRIDLEDMLRHESGYDIDHIYPQSRVKDDSIDNRVLVKRTINEQKGNVYPLARDIRERQWPLWKMLLDKNLISKRKFERLTRKTGFTDEELCAFAARQLVETQQSTKAVAQLLAQMLPESEIVYVKAGMVSEFRHDRDMLKVRELNDLHHAQDAYLNIVVGNVYNTQFTHSPMNYIRDHRENYTINSKALFNRTVSRNGVLAWNPAQDGSIVTVRKVMQKHSVLVTMMPTIYSGALFDLQPMEKGKGQMPLKKGLPIEKYGGYNKVAGACFMLVEHTHKKKRVRSLIDVPLYLYQEMMREPETAVQYCTQVRELVDAKVLIPCIRMKSLLVLDGFRMYLTGRTNESLTIMNANQLLLSYEWCRYMKRLLKFDQERTEYERFNAEKQYKISTRDAITNEMNLQLYDVFISKMMNAPYSVRMAGQSSKLMKAREKFIELTVENQTHVLCQIQKLFTRKGKSADLVLLNESVNFGVIAPNRNMSGNNQALLIHQSPTGLYEKVVDLKA